jgi:hypothetical protein
MPEDSQLILHEEEYYKRLLMLPQVILLGGYLNMIAWFKNSLARIN